MDDKKPLKPEIKKLEPSAVFGKKVEPKIEKKDNFVVVPSKKIEVPKEKVATKVV